METITTKITAKEAYNRLQPEKWAATPAAERLQFLEEIRENIKEYADELAASDAAMKNELMGEDLFSHAEGLTGTVVPIANNITACIHLYEKLVQGQLPEPVSVSKVKDQLYDIQVYPKETKDKITAGAQKGYLRVKGEPIQLNPLEKPMGIIAISGAGNYSSSIEMVKALFLENCAVIHKPHRLNANTDMIWEKIFEPLVAYGALSFCDADQGRAMTTLEGLSKIYFTGGTETAKAIMNATDTPLISECGGNNPCIVVPGDRPWTQKELEHQALQIASVAKMNGGAVCGRPQTIITSKNWEQRNAFIEELKKALLVGTPAAGTYYPGSRDIVLRFVNHYPQAEVLQPENGKFGNTDFLFIPEIEEQGFAVKNEAFSQVISELPLDTPANASDFLPKAVNFCNTQLSGTLGAMILIDEDTKAAHLHELEDAVTELEYGGIAINTIPPMIWLNPYLTWGGNEEEKAFVSGIGNFGNLHGYENVEKSILYDKFISAGHMLYTNKKAYQHLMTNMAQYAVSPNWRNLTKLMGGTIIDSFRKKDF